MKFFIRRNTSRALDDFGARGLITCTHICISLNPL